MNDRSTVNLVIGGLVVITLGLLALVGIVAVTDSPASVPEALWALAGVPIGALGSMLARTGTTPEPPAPPVHP